MSSIAILEELKEFDTALLANTIGYIDSTLAHEYYMARSIQSVTPSLGPTVGVAFTCEMDTSTPEGEAEVDSYYRQLETMYEVKQPVVWIVKTVGSRPDHECVLGDGMAKALHSCGCIGVVTDGGVRDVNGLLTIPFAAYSRGSTIHHTSLRVRSIDKAIEIGGITVRPGDIIHANREGVIKIPSSCLDKLAANARQMRSFECEAHGVLRRSDMRPTEKHLQVLSLLERYGFTK
jgi:4-hydroxy-4-methyl-2-oxoglutarate aldolase